MKNILQKKEKVDDKLKLLKVERIFNPDARMQNKIAKWLFDWWGRSEGYSLAAIKTYATNSMQNADFPKTYGLFLKNKLIGMFQIVLSDLFVAPHLYPWLANVFVLQKFRGQGFGRFLIEQATTIVREQSISKIYLYSSTKNFYEKFGFVEIGKINTFSKVFKTSKLYLLETSK